MWVNLRCSGNGKQKDKGYMNIDDKEYMLFQYRDILKSNRKLIFKNSLTEPIKFKKLWPYSYF